jgi:hypothetical protein
MIPAGLAVLHAQVSEDLVRSLTRRAQLNCSAPDGTMIQGNFDPVSWQCAKAIVGPFYCRHGLAGEIFDQSCRFKLAERPNTIEIHMDKWKASLVIFVNHDECRAGHCHGRCPKTLCNSANERRLACSERSEESDRFSPAKYTAHRLTKEIRVLVRCRNQCPWQARCDATACGRLFGLGIPGDVRSFSSAGVHKGSVR